MSAVRQLSRGFWNLLRRKHADDDIADEVDSFFAEAKADLEARGLTADDAARVTRIRLGSNTALREEVRSYGWENILDGVLQDLRYTFAPYARYSEFHVGKHRNPRTGARSRERHF